MHSSWWIAGGLSVHTAGGLRAGGLVPAGTPVADYLLAMPIIAQSVISVLTCAPLLSDGNCVRISTYVFRSTSSYLLVCQAYPYSGVFELGTRAHAPKSIQAGSWCQVRRADGDMVHGGVMLCYIVTFVKGSRHPVLTKLQLRD